MDLNGKERLLICRPLLQPSEKSVACSLTGYPKNQWLKRMPRKSFKVSKSTRLCSEHFLSAIFFLQNVSSYDIVCWKDEFPHTLSEQSSS